MIRLLILVQISFILMLPMNSIGNDATFFNPVPVHVKVQSSGVPIGTVIAWASHSNPPDAENWLECNGSLIPTTSGNGDYKELRALVGSYVPNYQGIFLRGYGSQSSSHYGYVRHTSGNLNSIQGDAIRNITGSIIGIQGEEEGSSGAFTHHQWGWYGAEGSGEGSMNAYFNAGNVVPITNENRPINMAVRYLIRAK